MPARRMLALWLFALGIGSTEMAKTVQAESWPNFLGPNGSAVSQDKQLPSEWSADKNVAWKVKVPGYGWSCPIVWGDKIFVTTAVSDKQAKPAGGMGGGGFGGGGGGFGGGGGGGGRGQSGPDSVYRWEIHCLNAADGKTLWSKTAKEGKPSIATQASNTYASETPLTDGERVYAYFGMTGVYCYDLAGEFQWKADLGSYRMAMNWGTGASPAQDAERIFVQCDNDEKSFLAALDKKTGKELWRTSRTERSGYSTPLVWKNGDRTEVVCLGSSRVRSYDPATGKELWQLGGLGNDAKASPIIGNGLLFVGSGGGGMGGGRGGFGGPGGGGPGGNPGGAGRGPGGGGGGMGGGAKPLFAVKPGAKGEIDPKNTETTNTTIAWNSPQAGPATATPLYYDGQIYILDQRGGLLTCLDGTTGTQLYKERIPDTRGFTSSPWAYNGKVFCLSDDGHTHVIQAGPKFKVLGENKIDEMCWATPAIAGGSLLLRTVDHLYCIRDKEAEKK